MLGTIEKIWEENVKFFSHNTASHDRWLKQLLAEIQN